MGIVTGIVDRIIDKVAPIAEKAVVDKDKLVELRMELEKLRQEEQASARSMYEAELLSVQGKGINFLRAFPRPMWAILSGMIFAFSSFTFIYAWWIEAIRGVKVVTPMSLPWPLFAIIAQVVTFYFGARFLEKKNEANNGKAFIERLGEL